MRLMDDCDILVPVEQMPQALAALADVAITPYDVRHFTTYDFKLLHGLSLRRPAEQAYHLDIHWRTVAQFRSRRANA